MFGVNDPFIINMSNYTSSAKIEKFQILLKLQKECRDMKCCPPKFICNHGIETIEKCSVAEAFFDSKDRFVLISHLHRQIFSDCGDYKNIIRASLVAQGLRICLPMQGTRVRALVWEDPTCRGATRPVSHNY